MHCKEILCTLNIREPLTEYSWTQFIHMYRAPNKQHVFAKKISNSCLQCEYFSFYFQYKIWLSNFKVNPVQKK